MPYPSTASQIKLIAWLRWRLFANMLRAPGAGAELVARFAVSIVGTIISAGIAFGLGSIAYAVMQTRPSALGTLLWGLFLAGQFLPLIISATSSSFDTRSLLRFPLRFPAFFLLCLSYTAFDPAVLGSLLWLASVGIGAGLAKPAAAPWIAAAVALLAAVSILLNYLTLSWVERLLARRRSREIMFLVFIFGMLSIQLVGAVLQRWHEQLQPVASAARPYLGIFPPGLTAGVVESAGTPAAALQLLFALAAWAALLFGWTRKRMRALYRGEELSEAIMVTAKEQAPSAARVGEDFLPFLGGQRTALLGKELRYLFRNAVTMLQLCVPFFLILFIGLMMDSKGKDFSFFQSRPEAILPSAIGYCIFISLPLAHNSLSFESWGLQLLLAAPVRFREVFLAKNLALGCAIYAQGVLVVVLVQVMFGPQSAVMVAATFTALLFILLVNFTVGNLLTVYFPRAFDFGSFRQRQSPWSVIVGMLTQIVCMAIVYLMYAMALWFGSPWYAIVAYLLLSAAMAQVYFLVLDRCEELVHERRDILVTQICRN